jgi:16S rRNA (adenine1518-N6/adenine1519-N6)-dimethyltransferase
MDLTKPSELKRLLSAHGLQLSKRFGQNFLVDRNHLMRVVETAEVGPNDCILEVGPGVGTLTLELATRAKSVTAVELDRTVVPVLRDVVSPHPNVEIVQGDALKLDLPAFLSERWGSEPGKVVANIPYNITSPLLVAFLENKARFSSITLMVQKEVADRLKAQPDTQDYGSLSVFTQYHAQVRTAAIVPRGAFFPPPKVDSAIVHLIPRTVPPVDVPSDADFLRVSRAAFGQRRKTLLNALSNAPVGTKAEVEAALQTAGVDGNRRGETLNLEEIAAITRALADRNGVEPPAEIARE